MLNVSGAVWIGSNISPFEINRIHYKIFDSSCRRSSREMRFSIEWCRRRRLREKVIIILAVIECIRLLIFNRMTPQSSHRRRLVSLHMNAISFRRFWFFVFFVGHAVFTAKFLVHFFASNLLAHTVRPSDVVCLSLVSLYLRCWCRRCRCFCFVADEFHRAAID